MKGADCLVKKTQQGFHLSCFRILLLCGVTGLALNANAAIQRLEAGGEKLTRTLAVDNTSHSLATRVLRAADGKTEWCSPGRPAADYLLTVRDNQNGRPRRLSSRDQHASLQVVDKQDGERQITTVTLQRQDLPLRIAMHYESYAGHAVARQWSTITNEGKTPLVIEQAALLAFQLGQPAADLAGLCGFEQYRGHGQIWVKPHPFELAETPEISFTSARNKSAAWLALWQKSRQEGLIFAWETSAPAHCRVSDTFNAGTPAVLITISPDYYLQPGETFEVPAAFVAAYTGDPDEGCYRVQRFVEEHIAWPNPGPDFPYLMFNTWGYRRAVDQHVARQAIEQCSRLGVELCVVDFGWEGPDWLPQPEKFPDGLAPFSDLCHEKGMKFGIHLSFANISALSKLYKEHPDWMFDKGEWGFGEKKFPVYALSLGLPEARRWAVETVTGVIDREKVDWFLTDTELWGRIDAGPHKVKADQDYLAATGFEQTIAEIHRLRPKVLIEHCDGGVSLINYKTVALHVTSITCDTEDILTMRRTVHELSRIMPPRYLNRYQEFSPMRFINRTYMFGGPWILMSMIDELKPGSQDWNDLVEDIALYKRYRGRIRDGKVLHLVSPGDPAIAGWDGWDAIGSYNPKEDAAIVFVYRTRGENPKRTIPMTSLRPEGRYTVTFTDTKKTYTATGQEIMRDGFALELDAYETDKRSHCSEVIIIEPAEKGADQPAPKIAKND